MNKTLDVLMKNKEYIKTIDKTIFEFEIHAFENKLTFDGFLYYYYENQMLNVVYKDKTYSVPMNEIIMVITDTVDE